jgi:hypothetical protein
MVNRNDSSTWKSSVYPATKLGILGDGPATMSTCWKIRQSEIVYRIFSKIYGTKKLWVSLDRIGAMRPTKNIPVGELNPRMPNRWIATTDKLDVPIEDMPNWKTLPLWLHWDLNPWVWTSSTEGIDYKFSNFIVENNGSRNTGQYKLQGLVALVDSRVEDGGFCCVPGFTQYLKEYAQQTRNSAYAYDLKNRYSFCNVHPKDCMNEQAQKIPMRAGSLCIWNSELPHCNFPNDSHRWRFNFYIKMFPAQEELAGEKRREMVEVLTENVPLTEEGRKLLGLEDYGHKNK